MSSSFWSSARWRLGTHMSSANRVNDLITKQIFSNADVQDVTEEDILAPIVTLPSKMIMTDKLFTATLRNLTQAQDCFFPIDPDLVDLRLWLKNFHGGRYMEDWSYMGNTTQLNGTRQSELLQSTDDDGVSGGLPVNGIVDDQYLRVLDNPNVRIKEIAATATGISIFVRIYITFNQNQAAFNKPGVLFSKIDTEQVDYAYAAYILDDGGIQFYVRKAGGEYYCSAPTGTAQWETVSIPDYGPEDFLARDYFVEQPGGGIFPPLPDPIPYDDWCFTFQFSNNRMQIIKNGVIVTDTNDQPISTGLVGWWRLSEGGDIGNTADNPSSYARTVFNSVATGNNGTIGNATWVTDEDTAETYLSFDGNDSNIVVNSYTAIQNLTSETISLWYYPTAVPTVAGNLVSKGTLLDRSWLIYHMSTGDLRFSIWNETPTRFDITYSSAFPALNRWYHIVAKITMGTPGKIIVNNIEVTGGSNVTGAVDTGTQVLRMGGTTSTTTPTGYIHDVRIWNRELSTTEVASIYTNGHGVGLFPPWKANPPTEPPPPSATTNPFVSVYSVPLPASAEQDATRLHKITASSLTERYNVGQGTQQGEQVISPNSKYINNPTYDTGTAVQENLSSYDQASRAATASQPYLPLNATAFAGQRFFTGSDVVTKPVTKVVVKMADVNSSATPATGNIVAKLIKHTGNVTQATSNAIDASTLPDNPNGATAANWANQTFVFGTSYAMTNGDRIQFEYDQGGTLPATITQYNQLATTPQASNAYSINSNYFAGERFDTGIDVVGKVVTRVDVKLCDLNPSAAPATGNVVAKIVTAGHVEKSISDNVDAATLADNAGATSTTNWTTKTFTFSGNTYTMASGDRVQFEYDEAGAAAGDTVIPGYNTLNSSMLGFTAMSWREIAGIFIDSNSAPLYDRAITKIEVKMCDTLHDGVGASGNITCLITTGSGGTTMAQATGSLTAQQLANNSGGIAGGSWSTVTFTFPSNTYKMAVNSLIQFVYNYNGSDHNSMVGLGTATGNVANVHTAQWDGTVPGWNHASNQYDAVGNFYSPGSGKAVGIAVTNTNPETTSFAYSAQWSSPNTLTTSSTLDMCMDVYAGSAASAKTVGIAYFTTTPTEANSNAYDGLWSTGAITDRTTFDFGMDVYIDTKTGAPNHQYTQMRADATKFVAEYVSATNAPIYGQQLTKITARVYKVASPTGTLFCRIKKGDGTTITFGKDNVANAGLDVSLLGTGSTPATEYTFENYTNTYSLATGDRVMFELVGGTSNSTNYVMIARTTTASTVPGANLQTSTTGSTWTDVPNDDLIGTMLIGGFTIPEVNPYYTLGWINDRISQKITSTAATIYNQAITQVEVWLKKVGLPTGTMTVGIRTAAGTLTSINTKDVSEISDIAFTLYPFTNLGQTYTLKQDDRITVEYSGGDASNYVMVNANLLDTYPNGYLELYTGGAWSAKATYDLAGKMSSGGGATDPLARTRVAELCATASSQIRLKKISRIRVRMKRTGLGTIPGPNVLFRIRNAANAIPAGGELGSIPAVSIDPNGFVEYTITSSPISVYALQVGERVSIEFNDGDDFNFIEVMTTKTTDGFDGTVNTYLEKWDDTKWISNNAIDLVGQMWEGGDTYTPSQEDVVIPPPAYTKDLHILAGGTPWTYVDHSIPTLLNPPSQQFINGIMPDFRFYRKILTTAELINLYTNRVDIGAIPFGKVAITGYFAISET